MKKPKLKSVSGANLDENADHYGKLVWYNVRNVFKLTLEKVNKREWWRDDNYYNFAWYSVKKIQIFISEH